MKKRDYGQIWQDYLAAYSFAYSERELRNLHIKWKRLAAEARVPGGKSI